MSAKRSSLANFVRGLFSSTEEFESAQSTPIVLDEQFSPSKGKKVLVVDDDPLFQKIISQKLKAHGFVVINAIDGSEAITAMREEKPDAVLIDVNFPPDISNGVGVPWDGIKLMNWIRLVEGRAQIPMFIVTSDNIKLYENQANEGGAKGIFFKPLDQKRLVNMVGRILDEKVIAA